jgi:hypothetical protein
MNTKGIHEVLLSIGYGVFYERLHLTSAVLCSVQTRDCTKQLDSSRVVIASLSRQRALVHNAMDYEVAVVYRLIDG